MDETAAVRESRRALRRVQAYLLQAHEAQGGVIESAGLVEVAIHPADAAGHLNYVTPRRGTAWVSAASLLPGLARLRARGRTPRVQYIEGLFPPQFAGTLAGLGLRLEWRAPLYICPAEAGAPARPEGAADYAIEAADEPLPAGLLAGWHPLAAVTAGAGRPTYLAARRRGQLAGLARLEVLDDARLTAQARPARCPRGLARALAWAGLAAARAEADRLVFVAGPTAAFSRALHEMGFVEPGSLVCFVAEGEDGGERGLEQPLHPE